MKNKLGWYEYKLIFTDASKPRSWTKENYEFIRDHLIPIIQKVNIPNYQMLNYFSAPKKEDFIRFRVEALPKKTIEIESEIQGLKNRGIIMDFTKDIYDPRSDAEKRIESVRKTLERLWGKRVSNNWKIMGFRDDKIAVDESDITAYDRKVESFEVFMSRILGQWTRIFIEEMKMKPNDIWLFSLYIHLLFNSLALSGPDAPSEESWIRKMLPY
jgi:hypothetical protein